MGYTEPDLSKSALVTIDVQRDFSLRGAPAEIAGTMENVPNMVRLLSMFRRVFRPIVHVVRLYRADGSNVDLCRRALIRSGTSVVRPGSEGAELVGELLPDPTAKLDCGLLLDGGVQFFSQNESVIYKPRWGAFYQTPLQKHLEALKVNTIVVCGCNFPNCPRTTIYEASERDFKVVLVRDAVSGLYRKAEEELLNIGVHLSSTADLAGSFGR